MKTHPWRFVRHIALPFIGTISALCLVPRALAQPRYLNLTWVDRSGEVIEVIGAPGEYRGLDVSPDGRRVAAHTHSGSGGDVWLFERDGEGKRLVGDTTGVQDNAHPIFSPDGTKIVYSSLRDGASGLYIRAVDGSGGEELVHTSGRAIGADELVARRPFHRVLGKHGVRMGAAARRRPNAVSAHRGGQSSHSQISPDGKWVAYLAGGNIWVRGFPEGSEGRGRSRPRDGVLSALACRWPRALLHERRIPRNGHGGGGHPEPGSIEVAKPQPLFDTEYLNLNHPSNYHTFAVSPDGERFLIPRPEPDTLVVLDREGVSRTLDTDN